MAVSAPRGRWLVRVLGLAGAVMVAGGAAHWVGISFRAASAEGLVNPVPYLILVGLAQATAGALLLVAARARARGERASLPVAVVATVVVCVYAAAVLPVLGDSPLLFQVAPVGYVVACLAVTAWLAREASR